MTEYILVPGHYPDLLVQNVSYKLAEGWLPVGGPVQLLEKQGSRPISTAGLVQAMIRNTESKG